MTLTPPQGWYIVTYALAIYHLNLLLAFLTPKIDPAAMELDDDGKASQEKFIMWNEIIVPCYFYDYKDFISLIWATIFLRI